MKSMSSSLTFFLLLFLLSIVSSAFAASPDSYEPDNTFGQATTITAGVSAHHSIYPTTDHDFVKFTLTATEDIELTAIVGINPPYMKINLYDSHELPLADDSDNPPVIRMRLPPGTYYAEYQHSWNEEINEYPIVLNATYVAKPPGKPARPYASDGNFSDKVKVTWNNHSGIIYKVYRCRNTSTTSCTKIGYTTSPFSDYHATHNVVYYYRIKACNNIGCSAFSNYDSGYRRIPKLPALMTIIQYILNN